MSLLLGQLIPPIVWHYFFGIFMFLTAIFLILLVLVQRGRGGGLSGALGGMGGQSAFGTKAGDTFTRITIGTAAFWIVLCLFAIRLMAPAKTIGTNVQRGISAPPAKSSTDTGGAPGSSPVKTDGSDTPAGDE